MPCFLFDDVIICYKRQRYYKTKKSYRLVSSIKMTKAKKEQKTNITYKLDAQAITAENLDGFCVGWKNSTNEVTCIKYSRTAIDLF